MQNDGALIRQILSGDQTAFAELVKKYQKQVHVLAWRKVGDFHIAEDITQDTFLKVYQKLHTLKDLNQFSGWLYVITTNLCNTWLSKNRMHYQASEDIETTLIERDVYSRHITEERVKTSVEAQREVVKRLLAKLKESERTVMTLHYLAEMTVEEISKFLGVSAGTIKSRLQRARNRLRKEEVMIREALENYQITPHLTENIMQEVSRLKPTPSASKPIVPWAVATASTILFVLMLGIGSQNLVRFQQPYTLDAQAETTIELVDAPVVLNIDTNPDVRNQLGNSEALGISENDGQKPEDVLLAAAETEEDGKIFVPKQQWIQFEPAKGSPVYTIHVTPQGELYVLGGKNHVLGGYSPSIFKLSNNETGWIHVYDIIDILLESNYNMGGNSPIAKWDDTLYFIPSHELFASKDDGKTWNLVHSWHRDYDAIQFILTDQVFYLAFDKGIFRSHDLGKTWEEINKGLIGDIRSVVNIKNYMFVGTDNGFYRLERDTWKRLKFPVSAGMIRSVTSAEEKLYVAVELSRDLWDPRKVSQGLQRSWWIYRSTDLGNSWTDITPTNAWNVNGWSPFVKLIASGETLLAIAEGMVRSNDSGSTWLPPQLPESTPAVNADVDRAVVVNDNIFYVTSKDGLYRSVDGGKSWDKVNFNRESEVNSIITLNSTNLGRNTPSIIYARTNKNVINTINKGRSWNFVPMRMHPIAQIAQIADLYREESPEITHIVKSSKKIYAKGGKSLGRGKTQLYLVSVDNSLDPIHDLPVFDSSKLRLKLSQIGRNPFELAEKPTVEQLRKTSSGATEFFKQLAQWDPQQPADLYMQLGFRTGAFAVSDDTFYMEYNYKLFRCELGDSEWSDTGLEETVELSLRVAMKNLIIASSGNTVYVGKRDGHLVASYDKGTNWIDLTPVLPFPVNTFNAIVISGDTVYVATDAGVAASDRGNNWGVITDSETTNLVMEHLAVDGTMLYGVTKDTGIYRLENGMWEQVVSDVPDNVNSFAVDGTTLYVGTQDRGMLHFTLEE